MSSRKPSYPAWRWRSSAAATKSRRRHSRPYSQRLQLASRPCRPSRAPPRHAGHSLVFMWANHLLADGDSIGCIPCQVAKYSNAVNADTCNLCMQNATSLQGSLVEEDCVCGIGHTVTMDPTRSTVACSHCPPGKYKSINGSSACLLCEEGSYSHLIVSSGCKSCPPNAYSTTGAILIQGVVVLWGTRDFLPCSPGNFKKR